MKWGYVIIVLVVVLAALAFADEEKKESNQPVEPSGGTLFFVENRPYYVDGLELRLSEIEERIKNIEDKHQNYFRLQEMPRLGKPVITLCSNAVSQDDQ